MTLSLVLNWQYGMKPEYAENGGGNTRQDPDERARDARPNKKWRRKPRIHARVLQKPTARSTGGKPRAASRAHGIPTPTRAIRQRPQVPGTRQQQARGTHEQRHARKCRDFWLHCCASRPPPLFHHRRTGRAIDGVADLNRPLQKPDASEDRSAAAFSTRASPATLGTASHLTARMSCGYMVDGRRRLISHGRGGDGVPGRIPSTAPPTSSELPATTHTSRCTRPSWTSAIVFGQTATGRSGLESPRSAARNIPQTARVRRVC